jgi:hypothetical protein
VNPQLILLIKAQAIDSAIQQSEIIKKRYFDQIAQLEEALQREEAIFANEQETLQKLEKEHRSKERQLEDLLGRKDKAQDKLFAIKTNKEYQAALQEIEGIKEAIRKQEDELLEIMEQIDGLKTQLKKSEELLKKRRSEHARKKQQIEEELQRYTQDIEEQKAARHSLAEEIDPQVLSDYNRLREAKNGLAVVMTKNELCMGCNMKIPPQSYNLVIASNDIIHCPNCRRILYVEHVSNQTQQSAIDKDKGGLQKTA